IMNSAKENKEKSNSESTQSDTIGLERKDFLKQMSLFAAAPFLMKNPFGNRESELKNQKNVPEIVGKNDNYYFARSPLASTPYAKLPASEITPLGWQNDQLERMANGLTGKLGKLYPNVGPNCAWKGGD